MTKRDYLQTSLGREMEAANVDAVIAVSPENVQHLAGVFIISQRMIRDRLAFAVFRRSASPFFVVSTVVEHTARTKGWIDEVVPYTEHVVRPIQGLISALKDHGLDRGRVWLEMGYLPAREADILRAELPGLEILDAEKVLDLTRMVKTPEEIELMTRNALVWEIGVRDAYMAVRDGESEQSIAKRLMQNVLSGGADWIPFISFASGPRRTMIGHAVPDETPVRRGDIMRLDMVGFFRGYYTDFGRMAIIGSPSPKQREAYGKILTLQREMIARAKPGVRACDLYQQAVAVGKELGMQFKMDAIGHSLGICLHEYPILSEHEEQALTQDMLLCIEIAHRFEGLGRFHMEDLIRVTPAGGERITTLINTSEMLVVG